MVVESRVEQVILDAEMWGRAASPSDSDTPPTGLPWGTRALKTTRPGESAPSIDGFADMSISRGLLLRRRRRQC
jgi:hypothetical protein